MKTHVEVEAAKKAFQAQFGALTAVGGVLGLVVGDPGPPVLAALFWAVATATGCASGLIVLLAFADFFLRKGEDDDVAERLAGGWQVKSSLVVGALAAWTFLLSTL